MKKIVLLIVLVFAGFGVWAQKEGDKDACAILELVLATDTVRQALNIDAIKDKIVPVNDARGTCACQSVVLAGQKYQLVSDADDNTTLKIDMNHYKNRATVTLTNMQTACFMEVQLLKKKGAFEVTDVHFAYKNY